jgi:hypothetical protein
MQLPLSFEEQAEQATGREHEQSAACCMLGLPLNSEDRNSTLP